MEEKEVKKTAKKPAAKAETEKKDTAKKPAAKPAEKKAPAKKEAAPKAPKKEKEHAPEPAVDAVIDNEDELEDDEVIELVSETGQAIKFYHVATIEYDKQWFVFFTPAEKRDDIGEDEVVVFRLESDEQDNEIFLPVEDEALLDKVYTEYIKVMEEQGDDEEAGCGGNCHSCGGGCH